MSAAGTALGQRKKGEKRSPLAQLLHALNQPLTGLQCSMEVALAVPRTPEQYMSGLREGLVLTERMRALVEAIREVVDVAEEVDELELGDEETADLQGAVEHVAKELALVAEAKNIRLATDFVGSLRVRARSPQLGVAVMQLMDSALTLAARGSVLQIASGPGTRAGELEFRVQWRMEGARWAFSRPELGLLIAQVRMERWGAWERESTDSKETVTVRLPSVLPAAGALGLPKSASS